MIRLRRLIRSLVGGHCRLIGGDCLIRRVARGIARLRGIGGVCRLTRVCQVICLICCLVGRDIARLRGISWRTSIGCLVPLSCVLSLIGGCTHVLCLILRLITRQCLILGHIFCLILRLCLICGNIIRLSRVCCRVPRLVRGISRLRGIGCLITCCISHRCLVSCRLIICSVLSQILRLILSDILCLIIFRLIRITRGILSLILAARSVLGAILSSGRVRSQIPSCRILSRIRGRRNILSHILRLIRLSRIRSSILRDILGQILSLVLCDILSSV